MDFKFQIFQSWNHAYVLKSYGKCTIWLTHFRPMHMFLAFSYIYHFYLTDIPDTFLQNSLTVAIYSLYVFCLLTIVS